MSLSALIRGSDSGAVATATVATPATQASNGGGTAANVASVAVANPRTATPAEADELRALAAVILPGDPDAQAEALAIALGDIDAAITCFRALAADVPQRPAALPELPTCAQCRHLTTARDRDGFRRCRAAARGELPGAHSRYCPDPVAGRRCLAFAPLPGDPE